ncbi:ABC transporter substrate-binding protein [Kineococcus sp. NBC_00420]|uniref:ABC transporter substrate-binding protein n=1 Tax=Kineococcus sp. NBC_00420 TaxID=2903564 RepID=UPI002E20C0E7
MSVRQIRLKTTGTTAKTSRRVLLAAFAGASLTLPLDACSAEGNTSTQTSGTGADAAGLTKVRFVQEWPVADGFWIPWVVAAEKGFFEQAGLDVKIITPPNVAATMQFLGTNEADLAFSTSLDVLTARSQGVPVIGIGKYGNGNNWGLMSKSKKPVTPAELVGKNIGTYNDAWSNAQLSIMLGSIGKTIDDVTLVSADSSTVPLLVQNKVDVITGITNAEGSELESLGVNDYSIAYSRDYGAPDAPVFLLAGNEKWLSANPQAAKSFITAVLQGLNYAREHQQEAVDIFMKTYPDAQTAEFTTLQWTATAALFGDAKTAVEATAFTQQDTTWQELIDVAVKYDVISSSLKPSELYTNTPLGA